MCNIKSKSLSNCKKSQVENKILIDDLFAKKVENYFVKLKNAN